jgi:lipopolysaccharide transport system ATP-binding protein
VSDVILAWNVGKRFRRYHPDRPTTLKEAIIRGPGLLSARESFWALRDVSFRVSRGEMIGLIGPNGAGKSTLLRMIGGVGRPDAGRLEVHGRVGALLDLGAGFSPDLTGRENVFVSGVIDGLTRRQVAQRFDEIVAFAELEAVIDDPLRTYSTGMQMRLAFAIAVHVEPDVLLIDEVLAVGDIAFQQKCLDRVQELRNAGCAVILVSHDSQAMRNLCDQVIWLRKGQQVAMGPAELVVDQYVAEMSSETRRRTPADRPPVVVSSGRVLQPDENRFGSLEVEIVEVQLVDRSGVEITALGSGEMLGVQIDLVMTTPVERPLLGVSITRDHDHLVCVDLNSSPGDTFPSLSPNSRYQLVLWFDRLDLAPGTYHVNVGAYERDWSYAYDYHWQVYPLEVRGDGAATGVLRPPVRWQTEHSTRPPSRGSACV